MSAHFSPEGLALTGSPIPVLGGHSLLLLILQLAVLLLMALLLGRLASLLKMPAIVGELLAGVVLGPSLAGWLTPGVSRLLFPQQATQVHLLDAVGQVGLILLVGMTGMQMDVGLVRRRSRTAARISLAGRRPSASYVTKGLFWPRGRVHPLPTGDHAPSAFSGGAGK